MANAVPSLRPVRPQCDQGASGTTEAWELELGQLIAPLEEPGGEEERVDVQDDEDEEVEPMQIANNLRQPTAAEEEEHRIDHANFRSWCRFCCMGRARGMQHRKGGSSTVPIIGLDYFFITKEGIHKKKELLQMGVYKDDNEIQEARQKQEISMCILTRCFATKCVFAHYVPCKGVDEEQYVANLVVEDVLWLGHVKMILKADNERAIQALLFSRKSAAQCLH